MVSGVESLPWMSFVGPEPPLRGVQVAGVTVEEPTSGRTFAPRTVSLNLAPAVRREVKWPKKGERIRIVDPTGGVFTGEVLSCRKQRGEETRVLRLDDAQWRSHDFPKYL